MYSPTLTVLIAVHIAAQFGAAVTLTLGVHELIATNMIGVAYLVTLFAMFSHLCFLSCHKTLLLKPWEPGYNQLRAADFTATVPQAYLTQMSITCGLLNFLLSVPLLEALFSSLKHPDLAVTFSNSIVWMIDMGNGLWFVHVGAPALWLCIDYEKAKRFLDNFMRIPSDRSAKELAEAIYEFVRNPLADNLTIGGGTEDDLEKGFVEEEEGKVEDDDFTTQMDEKTLLIKRV